MHQDFVQKEFERSVRIKPLQWIKFAVQHIKLKKCTGHFESPVSFFFNVWFLLQVNRFLRMSGFQQLCLRKKIKKGFGLPST
jgi:hypothetical protein